MDYKKVYYIIEPIDIDGDNNPDGFLASQYRIDKYGNRIYLKNKYITFKALHKNMILAQKFKKGGIGKIKPKTTPKKRTASTNKIIVMTQEEYNKYMNKPLQPPQYQQQHPQQQQQQYQQQQYQQQQYQQYQQYQQQPPNVLINQGSGGNSFMGNVQTGLGLGIGLGVGEVMVEGLFDGLSSMF
jgi:hypothetical protein